MKKWISNFMKILQYVPIITVVCLLIFGPQLYSDFQEANSYPSPIERFVCAMEDGNGELAIQCAQNIAEHEGFLPEGVRRSRFCLLHAYETAGRLDEALAIAESFPQQFSPFTFARLQYRLGRKTEAFRTYCDGIAEMETSRNGAVIEAVLDEFLSDSPFPTPSEFRSFMENEFLKCPPDEKLQWSAVMERLRQEKDPTPSKIRFRATDTTDWASMRWTLLLFLLLGMGFIRRSPILCGCVLPIAALLLPLSIWFCTCSTKPFEEKCQQLEQVCKTGAYSDALCLAKTFWLEYPNDGWLLCCLAETYQRLEDPHKASELKYIVYPPYVDEKGNLLPTWFFQ